MSKQKKSYKRKSVISNFLIVLIGIFVFLVILFVLVKTRVITSPLEENYVIKNEEIVDTSSNNNQLVKESSIARVSSYVFDISKDNSSSGYFNTLESLSKSQIYASLVIDEDDLSSYGGMMLNKFVFTVFDGEVLETFSGVYEKDSNNNLILKFLNNMYNNYSLPQDMTVYLGKDYAILDGNKFTKQDIASVYSNDNPMVLNSVFGNTNLDFSSIIFIDDDLDQCDGIINNTKFLITGFNTEKWDFYIGESSEQIDGKIKLKMKNYGLNTLNDVMPREVEILKNSNGVLIDNVLFTKNNQL